RLLRAIAQRRAQQCDRALQHRFADVPMAPDGVEQIILRREFSSAAYELAEDRECFRRQRYRRAAGEQRRICLVQLEATEPNWWESGHRAKSLARTGSWRLL